jgi:hypothetical protein
VAGAAAGRTLVDAYRQYQFGQSTGRHLLDLPRCLSWCHRAARLHFQRRQLSINVFRSFARADDFFAVTSQEIIDGLECCYRLRTSICTGREIELTSGS